MKILIVAENLEKAPWSFIKNKPLKKVGHKDIIEAKNIEECKNMLKKSKPDILIIDIDLLNFRNFLISPLLCV